MPFLQLVQPLAGGGEPLFQAGPLRPLARPALLQRLQHPFRLPALFLQPLQFPAQRIGVARSRLFRQGALFLLQAPQAFLPLQELSFQVMDAGALHLRRLDLGRGLRIEGVPFVLPGLHLALGLGQGAGGGLFRFAGRLQGRRTLLQALAQAFDLCPVLGHVVLEFPPASLEFRQIAAVLLQALGGMLDGLFQAGDLRPYPVELSLDGVEGLVGLAVLLAAALDLRLHGAQFRHLGLQGVLGRGDLAFPGRYFRIQGAPAQGQQLRLHPALLLLHLLVLLGRAGLALQFLQSFLKFRTYVA